MKKFIIETSFTFTGEFKVRAENEEQAREYIERHCGLVMGGNIHSSLQDDEIDWDFNIHPIKETLELLDVQD